MSLVHFYYTDVASSVFKRKKDIKNFVKKIFELEGKYLKEINYIFCSDEYLLAINKSFLKHNFYTDIITFDLSDKDGIIGEVYISINSVKENASTYSTSFSNELLRVIFHGALHLIGYKDKKKSEITIMREKEEYYLHLFESI